MYGQKLDDDVIAASRFTIQTIMTDSSLGKMTQLGACWLLLFLLTRVTINGQVEDKLLGYDENLMVNLTRFKIDRKQEVTRMFYVCFGFVRTRL